jgi:hypothetical protein
MNSRKLGILLFAGLMAGGTAARADDAPLGGQFEDWTVLGAFGSNMWDYEGDIRSIAISPSLPSRVMADVWVNGGYRSDNGGDDWTACGWTPTSGFVIHPTDPNLLVGVAPGG